MAKKKPSKSTNEEQREPVTRTPGKDLPITYIYPDDQRAYFSNYATVQREGTCFHVSFFEIKPPLLLGTEEEKRKVLSDLKSVDAHCLARIVLSPERAAGLLKALGEQLGKAEAHFEEIFKIDSSDKKASTDSQQVNKKNRSH